METNLSDDSQDSNADTHASDRRDQNIKFKTRPFAIAHGDPEQDRGRTTEDKRRMTEQEVFWVVL